VKLTAFEQGLIPVRALADEEKGWLDATQAESLLELGERIGARVASWHGRHSLRLHQFVGNLRVGDLRLEVLPKLDGLQEPSDIRRNLLSMLAETQDLDVRASELIGFLEQSEPFISALARLYCRRLLEAVRRGLRQDYILHQDLLPNLRGKVDWASHVKLQATQRLDFPCIFDERSEDTPLNRVLKAALLAAAPILESPQTTSMVTELRHAMDSVAYVSPTPDQLGRIRTDRMNRQLEPLLALAKLILGNQNPDQGRTSQVQRSTYALAWDMNVLFEEYIGRVTARTLEPTGLKVTIQGGGKHLAIETQHQKPAFLLRPDILIQANRTPIAVADTKWKRLDPKAKDLGVSESDVYQLLAYAHRYEVDRAFLLYPHHPGLGIPGLKREYQIQGKVRLAIVTLDLARLDSIPALMLETLRHTLDHPSQSS
jgi:5-methylcytosine-specific restriction enzyme subunit McrC